MLKKFCPYPGCREIILANMRYCKKHMALINERQIAYDFNVRKKRDVRLTAFYHSGEWIHLQPVVIAKYHGLDLWAYYIDHAIVKAEMVHHILPLRECWERRTDINNLVPLSLTNHGIIEKLYKTRKRETQEKLFTILKQWQREFTPGGG